MSLRLNRSEPIFRPKRELPGIGRKTRTRDKSISSRSSQKSAVKFKNILEKIFIEYKITKIN